jgi:hypothetical protein
MKWIQKWLFVALVIALVSNAQAAAPVANAGPDFTVADYDGNNSVPLKLNGFASTDADGDLESYVWTWAGGSADAVISEAVFPATDSPVTVTLTVTDAMGNSSTDTLVVTAYKKETALFTDFPNTTFDPRTSATIAGETLVLNTQIGLGGIYRRNAGVWTPTTAPGHSIDHLAADANTIFGGSFYNGSEFRALRFVGNEWVESLLTHPTPIMPADGSFGTFGFAVDPQTFVVSDLYNGFHAGSAGRVLAYDWVGNNLGNPMEIIPPGGYVAGDVWGKEIAVKGDLLVVASNLPSPAFGDELHIYRKTNGNWNFEANLTADPINPFFSTPASTNYFIAFNISIGGGKILMARYSPFQMVVIEKIGGSWVQTPISGSDFSFSQGYSYEMNDDGQSFVVNDQAGKFILYKKGNETTTWQGSSVSTRRLLTRDLTPTGDTKVTGFSNGLVAISDSVLGKARVIDTVNSIHPINVEPTANAGADITTTSFDGSPVRVFLNGAASRDLNYNSPLTAVWTWAGGSVNGLQAFADIPASVTSIELKVTDNGGAISRDTLQVNIESPPVINAGPDVSVVDADGNGTVLLNVSGSLVSADNPIVSWNWRWPGGTLNSQSGTITLGASANGQAIILEVVDSNGLFSQDEFVFRISSANPAPSIVEAADGAALDRFGNHVAIENDTAFISAPGVRIDGETTGATYLSGNVNNAWQQVSLSPGTQQGSGVIIDGDTAFVAAENLSRGGFTSVGGVFIYQRQSGVWNQTGLLVSPDPLNFNNSDSARFGSSMAKSGNWLLVGSIGAHGVFSRQGAAFLFEKVNGTWTFRQKLISPDAENFSGFGLALAISGDALVVTSQLYQGSYEKGVAHVFTRGTTQWGLPQRLEGDLSSGFGSSAAMNGTELLIGASAEFNLVDPSGFSRGVIYRYSKTGPTWTAAGKIRPVAATSFANGSFGKSMFLRDGILLVGSPLDSSNIPQTSTILSGRVHVFKMGITSWDFVDDMYVTSAIDPRFNATAQFGSSISHDGKDLIVGAPNALNSSNQTAGKVYIYQDYAALATGANYEPLANAGADIQVTDTLVRGPAPSYLITEPLGSEMVTLNGAASTDQENSITSYVWTWPGGSATGVSASARFPVGNTLVTLTITDQKGVVDTDTVNVAVSLPQDTPTSLPLASGNTLTLDLPSPAAKWRLSSEFLWHGDNESVPGVVEWASEPDEQLSTPGERAVYQVEILPYPGSTEVLTTYITMTGPNTTEIIELELVEPETSTSTVSFPETSQGFAWRLVGEAVWRNVTDDGDVFAEDIVFTLPIGDHRIEFKPVAGFTTPQSRAITITAGETLALDWAEYLRINNFDASKTFDVTQAPNLAANPYQYVGMIRSPLGRGTGTVVAERVVLTAAHLFFDPNGLQWADSQWFSRQQQGTHQAPPISPRGVLYQTSYAKLIAPDFVEGTVNNLPEDPQEVDFAVLYFPDQTTWNQGFANFLQSTSAKNWLTGAESKYAVGYPQRSQLHENRGKIFQKQFSSPLQSLGTGLYETNAVFGDGGASGSALFVQPAGTSQSYPAAILLAGQGRAVYRVIDEAVTRMIKDGQDAATGNDDVLNGDFSQVTIGGLGQLKTIGVQVSPAGIRSQSRWTITPAKGTVSGNLKHTETVAFPSSWTSFTITFSAISGYKTPAPRKVFNDAVNSGENIYQFTYAELPPPAAILTPLQTWQQLHGINNLSADGDKDGMNNLLEYALNRNPGTSDYRPGIRNTANPSQSVYAEFDVFVSTSAEGITYKVKASDNLDRTTATTIATFTSADGPSGYRKVTDTRPISNSTKRFAWLEVVAPSP